MKRAKSRTQVKIVPTGNAVAGYQVPLGNRPSLRDIGVVGASTWTAEQTETWVRTSVSATCPRRLTVFEGGKKDIDRCMEFGDSFDGSVVNSTKWTTSLTNGTITVSAGRCNILSSGNGNTSINSSISLGVGYSTRVRLKSAHAGTPPLYEYLYLGTTSLAATADPAHGVSVTNWGGEPYQSFSWTANIWGIFQYSTFGTTQIFAVNDTTVKTYSDYSPTAGVVKFATYGSTAGLVIDWVLVKKYTQNEPVAGTAQPSALNRSICQSITLADGIRACCA